MCSHNQKVLEILFIRKNKIKPKLKGSTNYFELTFIERLGLSSQAGGFEEVES